MNNPIALVVGARPNFMKAAPIAYLLKKENIPFVLIHTGQHYDRNMSDAFFKDLKINKIDYSLGVGSGTHSEQTGKIMMKLEPLFNKIYPSVVLVFGDVNSTVATALVTSKMLIPLAHIESGLRSFDRTMPEEINRIVTDALSDLLFIHSEDAKENLTREGINKKKIYFVGNIMIDSLILNLKKAEKIRAYEKFGLSPKKYCLLTLHRPSNVDNEKSLTNIFYALEYIKEKIPVIFPVHPRTKKMLSEFYFEKKFKWIEGDGKYIPISPLGYLNFLSLESNAKCVITDSGGIQEETTYLHIPCFTIRENTERPITLKIGTNILCGNSPDKIIREFDKLLEGTGKKGKIPPLWDGKTASRIISILKKGRYISEKSIS